MSLYQPQYQPAQIAKPNSQNSIALPASPGRNHGPPTIPPANNTQHLNFDLSCIHHPSIHPAPEPRSTPRPVFPSRQTLEFRAPQAQGFQALPRDSALPSESGIFFSSPLPLPAAWTCPANRSTVLTTINAIQPWTAEKVAREPDEIVPSGIALDLGYQHHPLAPSINRRFPLHMHKPPWTAQTSPVSTAEKMQKQEETKKNPPHARPLDSSNATVRNELGFLARILLAHVASVAGFR